MKEYLSVSKLNMYIKSLVESDFSLLNLVVVGEVTSLTKHYTGHYYFSLKDDNSIIKCMMFSSYASKVNFPLKNGDKVLIKGYIGVYEKGGNYQLYCRELSLFGEGDYLLKLAQLKKKLQEEGLFDKEKKKIPLLPSRIALISASTGAALHDYLKTIRSRVNTEVYLFPCLVQGENAPNDIIRAIKESLNYNCDLIVITRGGGSKEDLIAFNDEKLVRYCANLNIPLITAVGHKVDTTLIDYVADVSCITPTDAGNASVPSFEEINSLINNLASKSLLLINNKIKRYEEKILYLSKSIEASSPLNKLKLLKNKIDNYNLFISSYFSKYLTKKLNEIDKISLYINRVGENYLNTKYLKLVKINNKLDYLNPYIHLDAGYSLLKNKENQVISSIKQVIVDEEIVIKLKDGKLKTKVIEIIKEQ